MLLDTTGGLILTMLPAMNLVAPTILGSSIRCSCYLATKDDSIKHPTFLPLKLSCLLINIPLLDQLHHSRSIVV